MLYLQIARLEWITTFKGRQEQSGGIGATPVDGLASGSCRGHRRLGASLRHQSDNQKSAQHYDNTQYPLLGGSGVPFSASFHE